MYHRKYDKRRKVFLEHPVHDTNSHLADALRMEAISEDFVHDGFYDVNKIKIVNDYDIWDF